MRTSISFLIKIASFSTVLFLLLIFFSFFLPNKVSAYPLPDDPEVRKCTGEDLEFIVETVAQGSHCCGAGEQVVAQN